MELFLLFLKSRSFLVSRVAVPLHEGQGSLLKQKLADLFSNYPTSPTKHKTYPDDLS